MNALCKRLSAALLLALSGCSSSPGPAPDFAELARELHDPESIARLDAVCTEIRTSNDATDQNQDYNTGFNVLGNGWLEIADLRGPGVLTRFWCTGMEPHTRIRFLFDGEREPRLEAPYLDFMEGRSGLPESCTLRDQLCFFSGFPMTYRRRLRIWVEDHGYSRGAGKLFFQVNATPLPGRKVASSVFPVPEPQINIMDALMASLSSWAPGGVQSEHAFALAPGASSPVAALESGGTVAALRLEFEGWAAMSFERRQSLLREVWLRIAWDGAAEDSVRVPVGDFFGQMWQPNTFDSLYIGVDESGFACRFPMAFRQSAVIALQHLGQEPVRGRLLLSTVDEPPGPHHGYFHAGWRRSSPGDGPHRVLEAEGRGRLAGVVLGVASFDRSFWVLESNEAIARDGERPAFWRGTGLEDYFNGGWYYRTLYHHPLFGLAAKRPFRTVQYRMHLTDPVVFGSEVLMTFERGPRQASKAVYDSAVYYYLDRPARAYGDEPGPSALQPPPDEFLPHSIMTRLWDYERSNDFANAEKLAEFAAAHPAFDEDLRAMYRLRVLSYRVRRQGYEALRGDVERVAESEQAARVHAAHLMALFGRKEALVFLSSNRRSSVFLNGVHVASAGDPTRTEVRPIALPPGRHVVAIATEAGSWPDWVQGGVRFGGSVVGTDASWRACLDPKGAWSQLDYDDKGWTRSVELTKGPPEMEGYPFIQPDPYVELQSLAEGIRSASPPAGRQGLLVFRKTFEVGPSP